METSPHSFLELNADVAAISAIAAIPTILNVVCSITGMGFAAVARVTQDRWIACGVKDDIAFGLKPGGELRIETTICNEIRDHLNPVVINDVALDEVYTNHHTPAMYGFKSYISMPIIMPDGSFFGTLCAIDPRPACLDNPETIGMFKLFAELIAFHLDALKSVASSKADLADEQETSALREQFIAVLGHDLRNPLAAVASGVHLLQREPLNDKSGYIVGLIDNAVNRMSALINDVLDLARGRLGGGISLVRTPDYGLHGALEQVVDELRYGNPDRVIETDFRLDRAIDCDISRLSQLASNLIGNALTYGTKDRPVSVHASTSAEALTISVANGGEPISDAAMTRLFRPFSRGEVKKHSEGLGLGLYIASEIAQAHGGTLSATSTEEETRFTFVMPLA
ncbi:MAG TPA: GAF domain-containing sensor histidine kinase [Sphingobium sp.]